MAVSYADAHNRASQPGLLDPSPAGDASSAATDDAKRGRNLQKKLRQIQQLKERQAQGPLEPEQLQKLAGEQALLDELSSLVLHS